MSLPVLASPRSAIPGDGRKAFRPRWLVAVCLSAALAPSVAAADPVLEAEPNDTSLSANGPLTPDGYQSTINVADDKDQFIVRLQGRRQVTVSVANVSGCGHQAVFFSFREANGGPAVFEGHSFFESPSDAIVDSWTTPRDPTEYRGLIGPAQQGCTTLVTVTPSDALITGPLPAPAYNRTITVAAPGSVKKSAAVPITVTGTAADEDEVATQWTTGGCPVSPDLTQDDVIKGNPLAAGNYSVTLPTTSPATAGTATLCTWLVDTLGKLPALVRQQTVVVDPPPVVTLAKTKVRHGRSVVARVTGGSGKAYFSFKRRGRKARLLKAPVKNGAAKVSTKKLKPGRYKLTVAIGARTVLTISMRVV